MNKSIFDSLSVSIAELNTEKQNKLVRQKNLFVNKFYELFNDNKFIWAVTEGTAKIPQVDCRFKKIEALINTVLNND